MTTKVCVRENGDALIPASVLISIGIQPGEEFEIDIRKPSKHKSDRFLPDIPPDKTVQDFLNEYEQKYHITSDDFYQKWLQGKTDDDPDLNEWAGFYKTKLQLEEEGSDPAKATFKPIKKITFEREL